MPGPVSATVSSTKLRPRRVTRATEMTMRPGSLHRRGGVLAQVLHRAGDLVALADAPQVGPGVDDEVDLLAELYRAGR